MSDREIHAIAFRFQRDRMQADLTERQEWLFDALVSELAYRRRRAVPTWSACACELCFTPFTDLEVPEEPY